MNRWPVHHAFHGRLVLLGGGAIGQAVLPLLLRHIGMAPGQITMVKATDRDVGLFLGRGVDLRVAPLTSRNLPEVLDPCWGRATFCSTCRST